MRIQTRLAALGPLSALLFLLLVPIFASDVPAKADGPLDLSRASVEPAAGSVPDSSGTGSESGNDGSGDGDPDDYLSIHRYLMEWVIRGLIL